MGKLYFLFLTTIIGVSTTSIDNDFAGTIRNNVLEQQVLALLETLRETMLTGSDDLPILDPLQIERLHIDDNFIGLPGARVTINDLVLHYLSTFVVDNLTIRITSVISQQYSLEFEAHIPIIVAETGDYDLFISAMGYDIFGRGDGKVEVIEPKVTGSCTFGLWSMSISNLVVEFSLSKFEILSSTMGGSNSIPKSLRDITMESIARILNKNLLLYLDENNEYNFAEKPQLTGLFYHEGASNFANAFLANLVPEILDFYKDEIRGFVSPLLQDLANELLENVSIGDLFPQFTNNDLTHDRRI